jgi:single-stranded-DNA-specific exonuclease
MREGPEAGPPHRRRLRHGVRSMRSPRLRADGHRRRSSSTTTSRASAGVRTCVALVNPKCGTEPGLSLCAAGRGASSSAHAMLKTRPVPALDLKELHRPGRGRDHRGHRADDRREPPAGPPRPQAPAADAQSRPPGAAGSHRDERQRDLDGRRLPHRPAPQRRRPDGRRRRTRWRPLLTDCKRLARELAEKLDEYNKRPPAPTKTRIRKRGAGNARPRPSIRRAMRSSCSVRASWHPGVVGIVASRLMRQFHKPTFVVAIDCRRRRQGLRPQHRGRLAGPGHRLLPFHLLAGGGHDMAAGLSIAEGTRWTSFRAELRRLRPEQHQRAEQRQPTL